MQVDPISGHGSEDSGDNALVPAASLARPGVIGDDGYKRDFSADGSGDCPWHSGKVLNDIFIKGLCAPSWVNKIARAYRKPGTVVHSPYYPFYLTH